jgi:hypothetical protein
MALPSNFLASLEPIPPIDLLKMVQGSLMPRRAITFEIRNELRPVDLYCYLGGKFGQPNGLQNLLRKDDSDNLIHWEWTLRHATGLVWFQGMNFRTEIHISGDGNWEPTDRENLITHIKQDFSSYGAEMARVRQALEHWTEFVNPYQRIRRALNRLLEDLDRLELEPEKEPARQAWDVYDLREAREKWEAAADRYSRGFGLCFGIRSMLPVLAEAFVNLLIYLLMRPELKADSRLRENAFRQPIDVRIKSLSINCIGFQRQPDYAADPCKKYHSLVNERNDLLHGNVVIEKLKFNEVYFLGTVPIFREYRSVWERSLGIELRAVGLQNVREEVRIVEGLIQYLLSCLSDDNREQINLLVESFELGINTKTQRCGLLFPAHLVDFRAETATRELEKKNS